MFRIAVAIFLATVVGACTAETAPIIATVEPEPEPEPEPDPGPAPFGLENREIVGNLAFPIDPPAPSGVEIVEAFPDLPLFDRPVFLTSPPDGTDRIFVVERFGKVHVFANDSSVTTTKTFLDLNVGEDGEEGLFALAFDPDYANNGYFYVHYTAPSGTRRSVISRFEVDANDEDQADTGSETVLLEVNQPHGNHNGGALLFGPDDMLYASFGDGGIDGDNAQDNTNLLGTIIRIDPHAAAPHIPSDNPFVGDGGGVREEIFAFGFRNPWRMGFDRQTGDLWVGDVGEGTREEVSLIEEGGNYGWPEYEGNDQRGDSIAGHKPPVHDYGRATGGAVIGGFVYRGSDVPSLIGSYVYADNSSALVWALTDDGGTPTITDLGDVNGAPAGFGEDADGELYLCEYGHGRIFKFAPGDGDPVEPVIPANLSETGLFTSTVDLTPARGLIEYGVNSPLWSDGARKRRWIALPGNETIDFAASGEWDFPVGTVLVKHFELALSPSVTQRLETRVLVRESGGWAGYTYKWNFLQSDAALLPDADSETYTVEDADAPGGTREQTWNFPSRAQCMTCHTSAAGRILGIRTNQLNGDFDYGAVTDNQLRSWNHIGLFANDIGDAADYPALVDPADESASLNARARSYLASNCAQCHLPGGTGQGDIDLRFAPLLAATNLVDVRPTQGDLGLVDAFRVKTGVKESSVLWERLRVLDGDRMPRLGSNVVDKLAVDLIGAWIDDGPQEEPEDEEEE